MKVLLYRDGGHSAAAISVYVEWGVTGGSVIGNRSLYKYK